MVQINTELYRQLETNSDKLWRQTITLLALELVRLATWIIQSKAFNACYSNI